MYTVINHPIIKTKLSRMRNKNTDSRDFRLNLTELAQFMAYEVTKDLNTTSINIETPLAKTKGFKLKDNIVLVPILRAGLGMVDGFKNMIPEAPVGFIGLYRNEETLKPVQYYCKMPDCIKGSNVLLLDPMLATGHSGAAAIEIIKTYKPKSIKFVSILSAPEGIKVIEKAHPDVMIYTSSVDKKLNEKGYIVPGLGDAGDRIFGTK
ncbi:MAG: uracil phosphoribosyltransferase [Mycoplasmoidaceae bacterium]|nr:uracil phosphoribosyltransferase [Mycoplasmoidaceae bacterium]